jgi:hypothetical protein
MALRTTKEARKQLQKLINDDQKYNEYWQKELDRQTKTQAKYSIGDAAYKKRLVDTGYDIARLEKDDAIDQKSDQAFFKEFTQILQPPGKLTYGNVFTDGVNWLPPDPHWLYPPAYDASGDQDYCGTNKALGEFNVSGDKTGDGWGWSAVAYVTSYCTLWFYVVPAQNGNLTVRPYINCEGSIAMSAHDHWYTSTSANLQMFMHFDLFQYYWDGEQVAAIVDESMTDNQKAYWLDKQIVMEKTLSVAASDIVWIKLTLSVLAMAHSSYAHIQYDFREGADRYIRIPYIYIDVS